MGSLSVVDAWQGVVCEGAPGGIWVCRRDFRAVDGRMQRGLQHRIGRSLGPRLRYAKLVFEISRGCG